MIDMKYIRLALDGYRENGMECDDINELFEVAEAIKIGDEDDERELNNELHRSL